MPAKTVKIVQLANPTIDQVFEKFLAVQRERLKPKTISKYEDVLDLLRHHMNGYAYDTLSPAESALFDKHYNAEGDEYREFCQLFGPDKIIENLSSFFGYFMIRKVMAGQDLKRAAGTVTKKLSKWLAVEGYVSDADARVGVDEGTEAARDLPKAERATQILDHAAEILAIYPNDLADKDYLEFDQFTISKIEPGKLWLEGLMSRAKNPYGPVLVPDSATKLLRNGWDISCSLGRVRGKWRIIEVANIYPR